MAPGRAVMVSMRVNGVLVNEKIKLFQCQLLLYFLISGIGLDTRMVIAQQTPSPVNADGEVITSGKLSFDIEACYLPSDSGPCLALFQHYYFDINEQRCKIFTYGGCDGNANNFKTEKECITFGQACLENQGTGYGWGSTYPQNQK